MKKENQLEKIGQRSKRVPAYIRIPIVLGAFASAIYWIITFSGPYAWAATFQAKLFGGEHYIVLSGALALLAAFIPALIILQTLAGFFKTN